MHNSERQFALLPVSVILPTYNRAALVPRAIRSALPQLREGDELIVIDDGSTDATEAALAEFASCVHVKRIPNGGVANARNVGLSLARNPLVAFLDSDDEWLPGKLDLQRHLMTAHPEIVFSFTDVTARYSDGAEESHCNWKYNIAPAFGTSFLGGKRPFSSLAPLPDGAEGVSVFLGDLYRHGFRATLVPPTTAVVNRQLAGDTLHFSSDLRLFEDWECFARLSRLGSAAYLDADFARMDRKFDSQLTSAEYLTIAATAVEVLTRVWGNDREFLAANEEEFSRTLNEWRWHLTRELLQQGRNEEARQEMHQLHNAPRSWKILTRLPGSVVRSYWTLRYGQNRGGR